MLAPYDIHYFDIETAISQALAYAADDYSFWVLGNHEGQFFLCFDESLLRSGEFEDWDWLFVLPYDDVEGDIRGYFDV